MQGYIHPEIYRFGPQDHHALFERVRGWMGKTPGAFDVDFQPDRIRIAKNGDSDSDEVMTVAAKWIGDMGLVGKAAFNVDAWPDVLEIRNRLDVDISVGGYVARLTHQGDYALSGQHEVPIGTMRIFEQGWVAVSNSIRPDGSAHRPSAPRDSAEAAFRVFLSEHGYLSG